MLFRSETDQQENDKGSTQSKWGKQNKPVQERVEHPNAFYLLAGSVEGCGGTQADRRVLFRSEVPAQQSKGDVDGEFGFMLFKPGA